MSGSKDTIAAIATPPGRGGVGMIRVSGPASRFALETISGTCPSPRLAAPAILRDPQDGSVLDQALVLFFKGPASFTGEDVGEFHCHGGPAVLSGVLAALLALDGIRLAEAGEFTRRALYAGKVDLLEAEAIHDLVMAETAAQRRQAAGHLLGEASRRIEDWRSRILDVLARIEADLDFSDEDDVPDAVEAESLAPLDAVHAEIAAALSDRSAERVRDGVRVVLAGAPNVGKSSLLNALAGRDVAIVTDIAGTTRDVLEVMLDCRGVAVSVSDLAGLRDSDDPVESLGISRARQRIRDADLILALEDGLARAPDFESDAKVLRVRTKADLIDSYAERDRTCLWVSVVDGTGLDALEAAIADEAVRMTAGASALVTQARQREALSQAQDHLTMALQAIHNGAPLELVAEELRRTLAALGAIVGRTDVEMILDRVFSGFCVGK